ncbi:MAG: Hin recombinase, partial [Cryobacterium sp.]|nr:Hin recombinase [Cryobacterium sp.]
SPSNAPAPASKPPARTGAPGRKRLMTDRKITAARQLLAQGTPAADVAHNIGVSIPTLYRWIPATDR